MAAEGQVGAGAVPLTRREPTEMDRMLRGLRKFIRKKPMGVFGASIAIILAFSAIFAEVIAPHGYTANTPRVMEGPSVQHFLGTDQFGRDTFSRLVYGARVSMLVGVAVTLAGTMPALMLGVMSAHFGGKFDYFLQRVVDTFLAVPYLILLISIMMILGPSLINVIVALALRRSIVESRVMRGAAMTIINNPYIEAAQSLGATNMRIMLRHIIPNLVPTLIVLASIGFAGVILAEASLSFLGFGVPPPTPSWGGMLAADGRAYMFAAPWMLIGPTMALSVTVFGINMFGDALRDVLDPRLRGTA